MWRTAGQDHILRQIVREPAVGVASVTRTCWPVLPHVGKMTLGAGSWRAAVNCAGTNPPEADSPLPEGEAGPCGDCEPCSRIQAGRLRRPERAGPLAATRECAHAHQYPIRYGRRRIFCRSRRWKVAGRWSSFHGRRNAVGGPERIGQRAAQNPGRASAQRVLLLLLTTDRTELILPTIRSRCRVLSLRPMPGEAALTEYLGTATRCLNRNGPDRLARLARGCPGWAINCPGETPMCWRTRGSTSWTA